MPGVPTYRGCDACRKQKKKCDMATPACSRCARLKIACVGCGQLRYKFKDQTDLQAVRLSKKARSRAPLQFDAESDSPVSIVSIAFSRDSARSGAFASLLDVTDPSYDLRCYGLWFKDLPRRMGSNEALDAAVEAMVGFYPHLRRHEQTSLSRGALVKYVNALQALRTCLNDPKKSSNPETLCAVYILLICQGWTGRDFDQKISHGEGLAHLLEAMESRKSSDQFQETIRNTLYVPVILEAIFNPRIRLSSWFLRLKDRAFGPPAPITIDARKMMSLQIQSLARIPDLLHEPTEHIDDIVTSYQRIRIEMPLLKGSLELTDALVSESPTKQSIKTRVYYQASFGLLVASALIFNAYLRAWGLDDGNMVEEADNMANDAIKLAHNASQYRPLGASFAPLCLIPAWPATDNIEIRQRVVEALGVYQNDFPAATGKGWYFMARWLKGELDRIRSGRGPSPMEDYCERQWGTITLDGKGNMMFDGEVSDWFDCSDNSSDV